MPAPPEPGVRVERRNDSTTTYEVTVESELTTMEEAIASLEKEAMLTTNERLLDQNLQLMGFGPVESTGRCGCCGAVNLPGVTDLTPGE